MTPFSNLTVPMKIVLLSKILTAIVVRSLIRITKKQSIVNFVRWLFVLSVDTKLEFFLTVKTFPEEIVAKYVIESSLLEK